MFGRTVARFLITLALLAASVAWLGWLFLHTAGDPTRSDRIAHAILDNPAARHEVAVDIADALAGATNKVLTAHHLPAVADGADPALQSAVDASLADPRIAANLVDAISAEHAEALGETPAHPPAIDTALLVTAVRAHLLPVEPALARAIPAVGPAAIKLPTAHIPFARQVRTAAKRWVGILALGAVAGLLAALLLGDRAQVLRRAGWWAIGAGLSWAIVPRAIAWAGGRWVPSQAAVIRAVVQGAAGAVTATATALALGGVAAVVAGYVVPRVFSGSTGAAPTRRTGRGRAMAAAAVGAPPPPAAAGTWSASAPAGAYIRRSVPRGGSARGGPQTDTWTPHADRPPERPLVYDGNGQMTTGPSRRPGVTRSTSGHVAPITRMGPSQGPAVSPPAGPTGDTETATELDPTGPVPRIS